MVLEYFNKFNNMNFDTKIECSYIDKNKTNILVKINGDMEVYFTKFFTQAILNLFNSEKSIVSVMLDFKNVKYVSSSFIASILYIIQQAKTVGIDLFFTNLQEHMEAVIDHLGIGHFVKDIDIKKKGSIEIVCYNCNTRIEVKKLGKVKCPSCYTILHISEKGVVK